MFIFICSRQPKLLLQSTNQLLPATHVFSRSASLSCQFVCIWCPGFFQSFSFTAVVGSYVSRVMSCFMFHVMVDLGRVCLLPFESLFWKGRGYLLSTLSFPCAFFALFDNKHNLFELILASLSCRPASLHSHDFNKRAFHTKHSVITSVVNLG